MKSMMKIVLVMTLCVTIIPVLASVRMETRDTAGYYIATGVEKVGSANGTSVVEWDTTLEEDGGVTVVNDGGTLGITRPTTDDGTLGTPRPTVDILVLNTSASVVGGRMSASAVWDDALPIVVRDDIVVPSGLTLTLGVGCIVKFTEGARIIVEDGGAVVANGAYLAAFDDDGVGGDTDMNGRCVEGSALYQGWLDDAAVAALSTVRFVDGMTNLPPRTYTAGVALGALPELIRDVAMFGGWFTEGGGLGQAVLPEDLVAGGETVLYAHWIPYELSIEPSSVDVGCLATNDAFAVTANSAWEVACDADWVTVQGGRTAYPYAATVAYAVSENASTETRTATVRVTSAGGLSCDFTLTQGAMDQLAAPTINPADGTTFSGSSRRVSISGAESGAEIRYTLDGSEPTAASKLYTKSFNVFDTTVVKARAFKDGKLASVIVSSRFVRLQTLAEALDVPLWTVTSGGDAIWTVVEREGRNGSPCARSGAIGNEQESTLSTTVEGSGTLTFWWKVDCEDDDSEYDNWDYLKFVVDGAEVVRIDGDSGWRQVSVKLKTDGTHTLTWIYHKDYMDDAMTGVEDCGWVDQVAWTPFVGDNEVPVSWLDNIDMGLARGLTEDIANADLDGDGLTTAEEYVAGTDPNDPDSTFTANIEIVNGEPVVSYTPDLMGERRYKTLGKRDLGDPNEEWVEVEAGEEGNYNFFKVTVDMP